MPNVESVEAPSMTIDGAGRRSASGSQLPGTGAVVPGAIASVADEGGAASLMHPAPTTADAASRHTADLRRIRSTVLHDVAPTRAGVVARLVNRPADRRSGRPSWPGRRWPRWPWC